MSDQPGGPESPVCDSCGKLATGAVHAQWTLFDFMDWDVCQDCMPHVYRQARLIQVDGYEVVDLWTTYYAAAGQW